MGAKFGQNNIKGEQTRSAILEAAEHVLAENGYRGASLANIAERAGVTQSGLLHHFRSKEDLLRAILEQLGAGDDANLVRTITSGGADTFVGLRQLLENGAQNRLAVRLVTVLVAESTAVEHPGHEFMRERYERLRNQLIGALTAAADRGEILPSADLETLASALIAVRDGIQLQWIYRPTLDTSKVFEFIARIVADSIAPVSVSN